MSEKSGVIIWRENIGKRKTIPGSERKTEKGNQSAERKLKERKKKKKKDLRLRRERKYDRVSEKTKRPKRCPTLVHGRRPAGLTDRQADRQEDGDTLRDRQVCVLLFLEKLI